MDEKAWRRFVTTFERRGRARIALAAALYEGSRRAASFLGELVALRP